MDVEVDVIRKGDEVRVLGSVKEETGVSVVGSEKEDCIGEETGVSVVGSAKEDVIGERSGVLLCVVVGSIT